MLILCLTVAVDELVDWRFLYILNQVSPGPRIYIRVRDLKIQLPLHPVIPCSIQTEPAVGMEASGGESYSCGTQEQELQRVRWGTGMTRLSPQEYVSNFIRRAINICRPMRLRHLRPGDRPGLCVAEILRDQSYLLEWQVPLQCLLESSSQQQSSAVDCCNESTSSLVWPLPPYGMPEGSSPIGGEHESWYMGNGTIYSLADNGRTGPSMEAPDTDANDRLFSGVLDRGSAFASLLSPLSYRTTAVAIVVSAVLVAVATASATAALTTAAAATATLAARHSRIFRVDLHVIERDEHEDDQDGALECDVSPSRLVPAFSGAQTTAAVTPTSSYGCCDQVANEPLVGGRVGIEAATSSEARSDGEPVAQGIKSGPLLPHLQQVFVTRVGQFLRSSTIASLALTEASLSSAANMLSAISKGAITTASAALAAASASFSAVLLPPVTAICVATGSGQQHANLILWVRKAGGEWLRHRAVQLTAPLGLQHNAEVRADAKVILEKPDGAKFCVVQSLQRDSVEAKSKQRPLRHALFSNMRRRHVSESSAFVSPSPTVHDEVRQSQSILPPYIGKLGTFEEQSGWSMVKPGVRSLDCCDGLSSSGFTVNSGPVAHGLPTEVDEASILICPKGKRSISPRFYTGQRRRASPCASVSGGQCDEECRIEQMQEGFADRLPTSTSETPEQDFGKLSSGSPLSSTCLQPCHGLLLFVTTCLPRGIDMAWPHGDAQCCGDAAEWEALVATSRTAPPEDVPLLLPTDATASDLVRLLFLTLLERNYVLPVVANKHARINTNQPKSREAVSHSLHDYRGSRRGRSSSPTSSPRQNILRFWFGATQLSGEHIVDQPLPSAKLIADLRLMSCERLSLTVLPFCTESFAGAANARCLTLACFPSDSVRQTKETRLRGSRGVELEQPVQTYRAFHGLSDAGSQPAQGLYGSLLPRSTRAQDGRLAVMTSTPHEREPVLILRREASLSFLNRVSDSRVLSVKQEGHRLSSRGSPTLLQRDAHDVHAASFEARETLALPLSDSLIPGISHLAELSTSLEQAEASAVPTRPRQVVQELCNSAPHNPCSFGVVGGTCSSTSCARSEGILESDERVSRPWILRSSLNTRQFEYHPQRTNIMLTGGNDGTVSA